MADAVRTPVGLTRARPGAGRMPPGPPSTLRVPVPRARKAHGTDLQPRL